MPGFPLRYQIFKMLLKKNRQFIANPCFCFIPKLQQSNEQEKSFVQGGVDIC